MDEIIKTVAEKMNLPYWWIEAIAIEYTECRDYATRDEIWTFNFDKLSESDLEEAVRSHHVVVFGPIFHNVRREVCSLRTILRLVADPVSVGLAEEIEDMIAEGPISDYHFPFLGNPIDVWDPKLNFSSHFQVLEEGKLWQWKIADFVRVNGKKYGKWVSSELDLEPLYQIHEKLAQLRNPVVSPGEPGHMDFKVKVKQFYHLLDELRHPILDVLETIHIKRRTQASFSKFVKERPPLMSRLEKYTVRSGKFYTKFFAEPMFYQECRHHIAKSEKLISSVKNDRELVAKLDEIYQERASAIILGAACLEAFINGLGFEEFPDLWKNIEKISLKNKWQLYLTLRGKGDAFDTGREPYQSFDRLSRTRNSLVHFKRRYKEAGRIGNDIVTDLQDVLLENFIEDLPKCLEKLIKELCEITSLPLPQWLTTKDT